MSSVEYLPERVSILYRLSGTDVPIILVAASITAFALWGYVGVNLIVIWFVWLGVASTVRYAMARVYRRRQARADDAAQWENYFCLASALVGACWGLALMLIGHTPTTLQELTVTFLISSIAMGLPPSLAPSPKAFASFILPILAPMVAMLLTFGGGLNTSTALLMLVFATVLLGLYLSNYYALMETLAYGHENTLLLEKLRVAERSLTSALAEQQLIFDTAAVGIAFVSQGAVVKCNQRFAEIFGYAVDEIAGRPTRVWFQPEEDFMLPGSRAHGHFARGENYSSELLLRRKDGSPIWVFSDSRAINAASPEDGIIIGIGDITERKLAEAALQQTKERLDLAMQSSAISIWEWDARRGTIYLDAALAQMTGEAPRERYLTLEEMAPMVHPDDFAAVRQAQADCVKGLRPLYRIEHRLKMAGGDWVWVLSRGRIVEHANDGSALRITGTNVDITQRKRAEVELLAALQREKELSEMKSKFVSIASHELRTPLATILSSAELLEHYSEKISVEDRLKMLHGMQAAVKRMNAMIEDVLIIGKAEAGALQFEPQPVDLRKLCQKVVEELRGGVASQHVIQYEQRFERASLNLDEKLLRHILSNLLSNAVKYSPPGSTVSLLLAECDGQAVIEVGDQGIGIPPEDQARLFESFHRASNVGSRQGTGLGLVIVKKAVELHGGAISIESKVDAGTRISVHLPLMQAARAA
ncbi:MAG: PAS domain-containing sensor histidine kinase [Burkholderiales bacterium]|nr:PAS domain-containing sensor histidine kinase [Burkholderiales bacterium]